MLDLAELGLVDAIAVDAAAGATSGRLRARHYHRLRCAVSMADCVAAETARVRNYVLAMSDPHTLDVRRRVHRRRRPAGVRRDTVDSTDMSRPGQADNPVRVASVPAGELPPFLDLDRGDRADRVTVCGETSSGEDLAARAAWVAARLTGASAAAVVATPGLDTVVAVLAGLAAGVTVVPIPPDSGIAERIHIVADAGIDFLIGSNPWEDVTTAAVPVPSAVVARSSSPDLGIGTESGRPALLLYTSGTTGKPKGVPLTATAIAADLDALADAWAWTPDDTLVHGLPMFHVHGLVLGVLGPLRMGSRLVHTGRPRPDAYAAAAAAGGSLFFGVPTVWSRVTDDPGAAAALRTARLLVSGSAPLPVPVFDRLRALTGQEPVERYGMTETLITLSTRVDGDRRPGWVGLPLAGVETRIVDDDGRPLPADGETVGDLEVRGPTVMTGYHRRPEADREAFTADGWFRTGDVATADEDAFHRIVGRRSTDLIKTGGFRVGAGEVESTLLSHPAVREAAVVGRPDPDLGQAIVAFVVADGVSGADLQAYVGEQLSAHKRPREVVLLDALPLNAMGKIQKSRLR